ncbi:MAG: hypothetical protein ABI351_09775 [Herbaspirillum sp.]
MAKIAVLDFTNVCVPPEMYLFLASEHGEHVGEASVMTVAVQEGWLDRLFGMLVVFCN